MIANGDAEWWRVIVMLLQAVLPLAVAVGAAKVMLGQHARQLDKLLEAIEDLRTALAAGRLETTRECGAYRAVIMDRCATKTDVETLGARTDKRIGEVHARVDDVHSRVTAVAAEAARLRGALGNGAG